MKKRIIVFILILSILPFSLFSCTASKKHVDEHFDFFDTYCSLTLYADEQEFILYSTEFKSILQEYHKLFDIYNSYEGIVNLKTLNEYASSAPLTVSQELFDALLLAKELYNTTNGKCNVAIGALTSIWHDARECAQSDPQSAYLPSASEINEAILHTDINDVILDKDTHTVFFADSMLSLDFGAIAKGYVASIIYQKLIKLGCDNFLVNLGGNVLSHGKKIQNEPWIIQIENPFNDKSLGYNEIIKLNETTVVTSGSYQRYFTYNDKAYSHIIDTSSGYPADIFTSVSIQAPAHSSALADALSTALFCMGFEDGITLISKFEGIEALWILKDGSFKTTSGFGGRQ